MARGLWQRVLVITLALGIALAAGTASAVPISNLNGQSCGSDTGTWHFVNNQTGGVGQGQLTATWSSGDSCTTSASAVNQNTQHFICTASGTLLSASTNLPGKLVLSDYTCQDIKEPPPCDPKTQVCK
ncbi:MAG: hypothetical protein A2Z31_04140 [candidate division NC10 bacterium RBG_16_65_8]|nr:MAG: hypothetical protein A2Z31_04140 [candidate division NC10 bacterium RBG_16_65_8]